jgi:poly(A) polymerase
MSKKPDWLSEEGLQQLFAATKAAGGEARAVGGAVRDFLLDVVGGDVDVASTLTPEQTMALAEKQGWKAIATGIEHGTVTVVLPERVVEVTTLRRDVETDGRHATVAYTDNWQEDAARRDFTINALSMDADGEITDFFEGRADIVAQHVRFIGDAATRITEDGLRILRYFRFLASHGKPPADAAALQAIKQNVAMLDVLSGERIANEMRKLLAASNPAFVLRLMVETGVAAHVFPREINPSVMIRLHMFEAQTDYQTSVWARIVALLQATNADVDWLSDRWKLARHESKQLQQLITLPALDAEAPRHMHTRVLRLQGAPTYLDGLLLQAALKPGMDVAPYVALAHAFVAPVFPVTAKDLNMEEGKALGDRLRLLETKWEESDYTLTKEQLLALV